MQGGRVGGLAVQRVGGLLSSRSCGSLGRQPHRPATHAYSHTLQHAHSVPSRGAPPHLDERERLQGAHHILCLDGRGLADVLDGERGGARVAQGLQDHARPVAAVAHLRWVLNGRWGESVQGIELLCICVCARERGGGSPRPVAAVAHLRGTGGRKWVGAGLVEVSCTAPTPQSTPHHRPHHLTTPPPPATRATHRSEVGERPLRRPHLALLLAQLVREGDEEAAIPAVEGRAVAPHSFFHSHAL